MAEHATQAVLGHGSQLQRGGFLEADPFTTISEVVSFDSPDEQADDIEVSHFESPNKQKEYIRGMIDTGTAAISLNWNPPVYATHASLRSDKADGLLRWYRIVLAGAVETITFRAYVKGLKRNADPNGAITADVTFKVSTVNAA
jgi:hypothetical protein